MVRGRASALVNELRRLERRIERSLANGRGASAKRRRELYLELLHVLNGSGKFEIIPSQVAHTAGLTERIYRRVNGPSGNALPRAIYESAFYDRSVDSLIARGQMRRSEWNYVNRLARALHVAPSDGQDTVEEPPAWMIDVDESHQVLRVWIRELALQDMLLAAMESYLVPAGSGKPSTEVYGIVFGSYREAQAGSDRRTVSTVDVNIERVCIQHRAKCSPSEVITDERSELLQLAMGEELFPYWHLLGDFHTHTYRSLDELYRLRGWRYSDYDEKVNVEWCRRLRGMGHRPRVALILAITRAGRALGGARENWNGRPYVLRATIGNCHCFIAAYRIRADGRYSTEAIALKCPHLAGH